MTDSSDDTPKKPPTTREAIDALFASVNKGDAPGCVVGVAHKGRTIYRRAFGLANVALGVGNTPTTRMRIGSTSKHFTCAAVMLLAEEGKLDPDASIRRYIPELPSFGKAEPTLRQLMNHVGGIRCYLDVNFIANGLAIQPAGTALATQVRQAEGNFETGDKLIYCNGGFHLLSICIAKASGMSFEQFLKTRLFEPLGMIDTDATPSDLTIERGMATLHIARASGGWALGLFPSVEVRGEGSMVSTIDDMLRWLARLRSADTKVMAAQSWQQMFASGRLADGSPTHYALGLMLHPYRGVNVIHHAGGVMGGACQMLTVPAHDLDIVVITNGGLIDPIETANKIVDTVLGDEVLGARPMMAKTEDYKALVGTKWRGETSGFMIGFAEAAKPEQKGQLGICLVGNPAIALETDGKALQLPIWSAAIGPYALALGPLGDGAVPDALVLREGAVDERYVRLPSEAPKIADAAPWLVGDYASKDGAATAHIVEIEGKLEMSIRGAIGSTDYKLDPLDAQAAQLSPKDPESLPLMAALKLERKGGPDSKVVAFRVHTGRTRGLLFERA